MCGIIWAILDDAQGRTKLRVQEEFGKLAHRGPDASCSEVIGSHFLGNHRLAIINPTQEGNQPFDKNGAWIVCNGQIYNHKELAEEYDCSDCLRSDVDVILYGAQQTNMMDTVRRLDGDFAFVYVCPNGVAWIARDPVGVRPLFYGVDEDDNVVCAASEVKALIEMPGIKRCHVFPPGNVYDTESKQFVMYTDIYPSEDETPVTCSYEESTKTVQSLVERAVQKRIGNSDRPVAFLCSGGIDSSIVLALGHKLMTSKIHMFSIEYEHHGSRSDDTFYASMLASQFGVQHTVVKFTWDDVVENINHIICQIESDDPNTIRASIPMYFLAKHISTNTDYKVILSGEGADEIFMGYNIFSKVYDDHLANLETQRLVRNLHTFDVLRADRTFAAHGLELRVPFLDKDLLHAVLRIPGKHKMPKIRVEKQLLRDAFAHIPELQRTRILERGKERFSDGCGFGYVPSLLQHWSTASDLATKEQAEKQAYLDIFNTKYPRHIHLIIKRENPEWCNTISTSTNFVGQDDKDDHWRIV